MAYEYEITIAARSPNLDSTPKKATLWTELDLESASLIDCLMMDLDFEKCEGCMDSMCDRSVMKDGKCPKCFAE